MEEIKGSVGRRRLIHLGTYLGLSSIFMCVGLSATTWMCATNGSGEQEGSTPAMVTPG